MVKLASARESRTYGSRRVRNRFERINAGLYLFATVVLLCGFQAELSSNEPKSGLVVILIAFATIFIVNIHDLIAHLAGIDCRLPLMEFDLQLALVEFAAPLVQAIGTILFLLATLFLFLQEEKGYGYYKMEKHALNMLVAGPVLWLLGSVQNSCQIYERADAHVQMLQQSVHIPFLMGSLLFLGKTFTWLGIFGSVALTGGGFANVIKVIKMQQGQMRLEKLRGGAQELLIQDMEGQFSIIMEEQRQEEGRIAAAREGKNMETANSPATSYKDVLVAGH